jgi:hypothetical protein
MRISPYIALLDACFLAPMPIMDTLLRLAEEPVALYVPKWSAHILSEVEGVLGGKFGYSDAQVRRRIETMKKCFPESLVEGYADLIPAMTNPEEDRHVLAAAVKCGAHCIVTDNLKHFPKTSLAPFELDCLTADAFLDHQYHLDADTVIAVLTEQAMDIGWTLPQLLSKHVPSLGKLIKT